MKKQFHLVHIFTLLFLSTNYILCAQPVPGDVYRDYVWTPDMVMEKEKFLRVGGNFDYQTFPDHFPPDLQKDGHIRFEKNIDLQLAIRAELEVEMVSSHGGTTGLKIQVNKNAWMNIHAPESIPKPRENYMYHTNATFDLPLHYVVEGDSNTFKMEVDQEHPGDWPQNLIYGVIIRVYYNYEKPHPTGKLDVVSSGKEGQQATNMKFTPLSNDNIKSINFIANYEEVNWEGDGNYTQWHYFYHQGEITKQVYHLEEAPFRYKWQLDWVPDQQGPIELAAIITDENDIRYFTARHAIVQLKRKDFSVKLYKPENQPENWVTREAEYEEHIDINEKIGEMKAAQLYWTSWSPCYSNGIYINDHLVFMREGPCYAYFAHSVQVDNLKAFEQGNNIIKTGKIPLFQGQMVHGMEVQWPGIMVKIQYQK